MVKSNFMEVNPQHAWKYFTIHWVHIEDCEDRVNWFAKAKIFFIAKSHNALDMPYIICLQKDKSHALLWARSTTAFENAW